MGSSCKGAALLVPTLCSLGRAYYLEMEIIGFILESSICMWGAGLKVRLNLEGITTLLNNSLVKDTL